MTSGAISRAIIPILAIKHSSSDQLISFSLRAEMLSVLRKAVTTSAVSRAVCLTPLVQRKLSNGSTHVKTAQAFESIPGSLLANPRTEYRNIRIYQGKIKAVILDWAGTVLDCGVYSPAVVFVKVFEQEGVPITMEEAREPMGRHKKVHIRMVTQIDSVRKRWKEKFGRSPTEEDVERMFENFVPMQLACLDEYSEMITGAVDTVNVLQKDWGLKIGSTTGFTTPMVDILKKIAAENGYEPDCYVAADEVPQARPFPYMVWLNAIRLDVNPISAIVKVDDTKDGVREGTSAGCWSVGLARTGNYVALNEEEINELSDEEYELKLAKSYETLANAGAHYVIDSIAELPPVIEDINRRLAAGERP